MSFPPLSRVIHPSFTGHTVSALPGRYVASFHGGIITPLHHLYSSHGQWYYGNAIKAIERLTREYERSYLNAVSPGMWLDNGLVYFDVSTSFDDVDEALKFARNNGQLAIRDMETETNIPVPVAV